ncbi:uncharacterized protein LOC110435393 [Sorghum bicolor]|uniref:uncharacterized protein LOC110435393 n=1 Tax=Sorghum bicolor TaxID=4558 RepID=UPI000B424F32|nr:uncharacterized protein LOC110435393 [Sorghum bicolor]|eukprot:XP_021316566.1 uncharacterized protein LOC110435393 [Sorghum bicolor]
MAPGKTNPSQSERVRRQLRDANGKFTLPSSSAVASHLRGAVQPHTPASAMPRTRWAAIQAGTPSSSVAHRQHQFAPIQVDSSTSSSDYSTCDEKDDHDSVTCACCVKLKELDTKYSRKLQKLEQIIYQLKCQVKELKKKK